MRPGVIFDVKEMAVYDGPGVRVTVFFKGCPLSCMWCHNPEGLIPSPQLMRISNGCHACKKCQQPCSHLECATFDLCTKICPEGLIRVVGEWVESKDLANRLKQYAPAFGTSGGVTISGGEPLMQPDFLLDLLQELKPLHTALETSGYGSLATFEQAVELTSLILFDLKLVNEEKHRKFTGRSNGLILQNLNTLKASGKPFVIRMPIIPGLNDTRIHFQQVTELLADAKERVSVEILPYNPLAGAKYDLVGLPYPLECIKERKGNYYPEILEGEGIKVRIL